MEYPAETTRCDLDTGTKRPETAMVMHDVIMRQLIRTDISENLPRNLFAFREARCQNFTQGQQGAECG